jgi:hypothetical protein
LIVALACWSLAVAAPTVIGVVRAPGDFLVDQATVSGNSTVFDGATIETGRVRSEATLKTGETLALGADSRARIFSDRVILERGLAELRNATRYRIETPLVAIRAGSTGGTVLAGVDAGGQVRVASITSGAEVRNREGVLVARLLPGTALNLAAQAAGASAPVRMTGVVTVKNGVYLLTDATTHVTVELKGSDLKKYVGKRVSITGTPSGPSNVTGASQIITIASVNVIAAAGAAGAGAAGAGAAAAGTSAGIGIGTVAVIGGVVATAGTIGGLYAAGTIGGSDSNVSR